MFIRQLISIVAAVFSCAVGVPQACSQSIAAPSVYNVGTAAVDVTPSYPVRLNGFAGRKTESEGVTQRIWAKALAISSGDEKPIVLISLDSLGIRESMVNEVAERLKKKAGIERKQIAVAFSHSHTTPKVNGACDTVFCMTIPAEHQAHIDRYTKELTDAIEAAALKALDNRAPSKLFWAVGKVGFAKNRRTPGGPVDHSLPMLVVKSAKDDSIRAIYVTYACHCVTLGHNKISGDWSGYAQAAIEENHPGAVGMVSIGCGSDANPVSDVTDGKIAVASDQGKQIGDEVERLLKGEPRPISGPIVAKLAHIDLPLNPPPTRDQLIALGKGNYNATFQLEKLDRGEKLLTKFDYPIQTWAFGESLEMVFLAGEVCVDYATRLRQEIDWNRLWIHGYSNDFCSYIPSERLLKEGGYGGGDEFVYFALPNTLQPGLEDKIINELLRQTPATFRTARSGEKGAGKQPLSPAESLSRMKTHDELVVELMAAEPLLEDPVAIDFGWDGRVWVAEAPDYTRALSDAPDKGGSVKVLIDRDADGRFDNAVVFQGGLRFPFDVKVWRDGVIVCDAPDVIYLEDTDGDQKADIRKVLLTGFGNHNAQARVNSLRWGVDGWLYGSCGLFGGRIRSFNGMELELGDRDFRFHPDTGVIEPVTGRTQQGRACDSAGNWFGCNSGTMVAHYPLSEHYMARNPLVTPPSAQTYCFTQSEELFPAGNPTILKLSGPPGRPTSACGLEIYRDDLLGADYAGNSFTAEPVNMLVHRRVLSPQGVTFSGRRASNESNREFLTSTDTWFRPVQIRTGLDGCLWVVDMHRAVIEHPTWISPEAMHSLDPRAGSTEGRIYRIRPKSLQPRPIVDLRKLDVSKLVSALDSPNGPQRDLAQQLLLQRDLRSAAPQLERLFLDSKRADTRLCAITTLDGLNSLSEEILIRGLSDSSSTVRSHAVRLSESRVARSERVADALLARSKDGDAQVQLQLAYTFGEWDDPRGVDTQAEIAWKNQDDPYLLAAAWSSVTRRNAVQVFKRILAKAESQAPSSPIVDAISTFAAKLAERSFLPHAIDTLRGKSDAPWTAWRVSGLASLMEALDADARNRLLSEKSVQHVVSNLAPTAREIVRDPTSKNDRRVAAMRFLGAAFSEDEPTIELVATVLDPQNAPAMQLAALRVLSASHSEKAAHGILSHWDTYTPAMRSQVLDVVVARQALLDLLLDKLESGELKGADIDATHRLQLLSHNDVAIKKRAERAFGNAINSDRRRIVEEYQSFASLDGDTTHGGALFQKHCSSCHKLGDIGHAVGPDLAALTNRTPSALIESIFDPNRAVEEKFRIYAAIGDDGLTHTGILVGETATSITLMEQQGKQSTLLRESLESLKSTGLSMMPEGLEKDLTLQDVADLMAYFADQFNRPKTNSEQKLAEKADVSHEISTLIDGLAVGTDAEYERIPKIWEHAIAAGKRNRPQEIVRLLQLALPKLGEPLRDWQAVVIGGGVINGISSQNIWPRPRIMELIARDETLQSRWERTLELAAQMADNPSIRLGTRYDALRILGTDRYERVGSLIAKYLNQGVDHELQMGAISAFGDIDNPSSAVAILKAFSGYEVANRDIALAALLRTENRAGQVLDILESDEKVIKLTPAEVAVFKQLKYAPLRKRVQILFGNKADTGTTND